MQGGRGAGLFARGVSWAVAGVVGGRVADAGLGEGVIQRLDVLAEVAHMLVLVHE